MFLSLLFLFSALATAHPYSKAKEVIEKYNLHPLVDSHYFVSHPDTLPYKKCLILSPNLRSTRMGLLVINKSLPPERRILFCYSKKARTGYMIPIFLKGDHSVGLSVAVSDARKHKIRLSSLDKKPLKRIIGEYKGVHGGLGLIFGFSGSYLKNGKVKLRLASRGFGLEVEGAYRSVELSLAPCSDWEQYSSGFLEQREKLKLREESGEISDWAQELAVLESWPVWRKYAMYHRFYLLQNGGGANPEAALEMKFRKV